MLTNFDKRGISGNMEYLFADNLASRFGRDVLGLVATRDTATLDSGRE